MTIEEMIESGIDFLGAFEVRVFEGESGCWTVLDRHCDPEWGDYEDEDWYQRFPVTSIYSDGLCYVIEVDGEED